MAFKDLHDFVRFLDKKGQLKRITAPASPILEITEVTDRVCKAALAFGLQGQRTG